MDLMTGAGAFATIVGLLSSFKAERSGGEMDEFILWLKEKRHEDVVAGIEHNKGLATQLTGILSTNHEVLVQKLASLDEMLSSVATHVESFSGLAQAIHPHGAMSTQAMSVLKQLVESGAKLFMEHKVMSGEPDDYILMDGANGSIKYDEPRFMEDDLETLVRLGLLRLEFGSKGSRRFFITREAVRFVHAADR